MEAAAQVDVLDTLPEVLQFTGISKPLLYKLIRSGKFPAPCKVGRASRWPRSETVAWIEARKADRSAGATA